MVFEYRWPDAGLEEVTSTMAIDTYTYFALVASGEGVLLYRDGVLRDSAIQKLGAMGARSTAFAVGTEPGSTTHNWVGAIDELAIYDRALGPSDIARHHAAAATP